MRSRSIPARRSSILCASTWTLPGRKRVAIRELPGDTPQRDTNLDAGEVITAVELPPKGFARNYSHLKVCDRLSYAFALVAVGLELDG
jgi:CO/xanthine dehydrogenase FAD-binding subunit